MAMRREGRARLQPPFDDEKRLAAVAGAEVHGRVKLPETSEFGIGNRRQSQARRHRRQPTQIGVLSLRRSVALQLRRLRKRLSQKFIPLQRPGWRRGAYL